MKSSHIHSKLNSFILLTVILLCHFSFCQTSTSLQPNNRSELWHKNYKDILSGFGNMYNFHVLYEPDTDYPFKAWFFGWAVKDCNANVTDFKGCDAIFAARAKQIDGPWEVYKGNNSWDNTGNPELWGPLFSPTGTYFDEWHNGDPSVIKVNGKYYMAYSATGHDKDRIPANTPNDTDGDYYCVMGAVSDDGIHWNRSEKPILAYTGELGGKDKAGDVTLYGTYHRPSIMFEEGKFKIWFDYWTNRGTAMGYAENQKDFLNAKDWKLIRVGENPCLWEFPNPDVVKVDKIYYAYADPGGYENHEWKGRKITEAVSKDGINWQLLGYIEPDPDTPATHVPEALVMQKENKNIIYLFYSCQIGGNPEYNFRYNRIRYMWREVPQQELNLIPQN
ncbi:MAG TPA: hypothetical protein PLX23_12825 [Candidatus Hydrogenedens sp.]|nr:hypothetical protein [Candidatus Hydrogenedens sp.]